MKKITLLIAGKNYTITMEEDFAKAYKKEVEETFSRCNNSIETLLNAYMKKSYEYYKLEKEIQRVLKKIEEPDGARD